MSGLSNLGNTCYINSIIQCLIHTPNISKLLKSRDLDKRKKEASLVREFIKIINVYGKYAGIRPIGFRHEVGQLNKIFSTSQQQDSHEFLVYLIDSFHIALSYSVKMTSNGIPKTEEDYYAIDAFKDWDSSFKKEYSNIIETFYGQFHSQLSCNEDCENVNNKFEPFCYLPLSVNENSTNLYELLDDFTKTEIVEGWKCDKCECKKKASKKLYIWRAPNILIIQLKKFNGKPNVFFPKELDIQKYVSCYNNKPTKYELYSVCNHVGEMNSGHYYSYCKNEDKWMMFDDETITLINEVVSPNAYLLFYKIKK